MVEYREKMNLVFSMNENVVACLELEIYFSFSNRRFL